MNDTETELGDFANSDFDDRPMTRTERLNLYGSPAEWQAAAAEERRFGGEE